MTFLIIGIIVTVLLTIGFGWYAFQQMSEGAEVGFFLSGLLAVVLAILLICFGADAKMNKALIRAHLENPTNYTYTQLAEHNEFVTKAKVWQGTIFSFYNDVDLQPIDIDNVSQKVVVKGD